MNHLTHAGAGAYSAVSPAGSYGSYHRTNTASSLEDGSGSGRASGVSSGMMGSDSSRVSEFLSETSRVVGVIESGGYGTQYAVEDGSRGDLLVREGHRERVPGRGEAIDDHGQMQARGAGHAHSTSLSTVTGSPPQPQGGPSAVPIGAAFAGSGFGSGSGHQVQPGYSVQPSDTHYRLPPQVLGNIRTPKGQYHHETAPASHATAPSAFANLQSSSGHQMPSQRMGQPQGQGRTALHPTRAGPTRTSTKRPRAPKRPRSDLTTGPGIGPSRGNLVESDDDSEDDEVIEWVPGLGDSGTSGNPSYGFGGNAGTDELAGAGGATVQAVSGLPGGRKCVSILSRCPILSPLMEYVVKLTGPFSFSPPSIYYALLFVIFHHLRPQRTTCPF